MVEVADEAAPQWDLSNLSGSVPSILVVLGLSSLFGLSLLVLPAPPYKGGGPGYKLSPCRTQLSITSRVLVLL